MKMLITLLVCLAADIAGTLPGTSQEALPGDMPATIRPSPAASNEIAAENALPGTPGWRIQTGTRAMGGEIAGYIPRPSVEQGDSLSVHVNRTGVDAGKPYTVEVFRLGWYGGIGARLVAGPVEETAGGDNLPRAEVSVEETGLFEADWPLGFVLSTQTDGVPWTSGAYVVRLSSNTGKQVYVPFTLRSHAPGDFLFLQSHLTWQAYNEVSLKGGNSLYAWGTRFVASRRCSLWLLSTCIWWGPSTVQDTLPHLPNYGRLATQVSFRRPYGPWFRMSDGAGEALYYEWPIIQWLERESYDVSYAADFDLEFGPVPDGVRAIVLPSHSEYWTQQMRDRVEEAQSTRGTGLVSLGANQVYWRGRIEGTSASDVGTYTVYKQASGAARPDDPYYGHPGLETGQFRQVGEPEQLLLGSQYRSYFRGSNTSQTGKSYHGYIDLGPAENVAHPLLAGTGINPGERFPGLLGGEFDQIMTQFPHHPNVTKVFTSFVHHNWYASNVTMLGSLLCSLGLSSSCLHTYAHSVAFELAHQDGTVTSRTFNAGTFNWGWGLSTFELHDGTYAWENPKIQQLTRNVLAWAAHHET